MSDLNQDLLFEGNPRAETAEADADKLARLLERLLSLFSITNYPDRHPIQDEVASTLAARSTTKVKT